MIEYKYMCPFDSYFTIFAADLEHCLNCQYCIDCSTEFSECCRCFFADPEEIEFEEIPAEDLPF